MINGGVDEGMNETSRELTSPGEFWQMLCGVLAAGNKVEMNVGKEQRFGDCSSFYPLFPALVPDPLS